MKLLLLLLLLLFFAIGQAVSRLHSNAVGRVRSQVRSCGIFGEQSAGFLRVLRFPLLILIPPTDTYPLIVLPSKLYSRY
jgi:hypothetical protein